MSTATTTPGLSPLASLTGPDVDLQAAELLATGKIKPAEFVAWSQARRPKQAGWHPDPIRAKVTEKGCLHLAGCHNKQFGLTLYASTWEYVLDRADQIRAALAKHADQLARK